MSNNIYKANFIQFSPENTKVIDANSLVAKRLEGFSGVLREKEEGTESEALSEYPDGEDEGAMAELLADRDAVPEEEPEPETEESLAEKLERMRLEAEEEIGEMKNNALSEIEALKQETLEAAREQGYSEGAACAEEEYNHKLGELQVKMDSLEGEYQALAEDLEPRIVDAVTDIYKRVFGDNFFNRRDVILALVSKALAHAGTESYVMIHASAGDAEILRENKEALFESFNYEKEPEIRIEESYPDGRVKVETEYGILDCGIDTELNELSRVLHLLSYEGGES
ncbi:MAG: hypothetical protein K6A74_06590 [Lachnospiraceae bacterium]|nr:hypothetical protein [Lachnospiraceae bacterium]